MPSQTRSGSKRTFSFSGRVAKQLPALRYPSWSEKRLGRRDVRYSRSCSSIVGGRNTRWDVRTSSQRQRQVGHVGFQIPEAQAHVVGAAAEGVSRRTVGPVVVSTGVVIVVVRGRLGRLRRRGGRREGVAAPGQGGQEFVSDGGVAHARVGRHDPEEVGVGGVRDEGADWAGLLVRAAVPLVTVHLVTVPLVALWAGRGGGGPFIYKKYKNIVIIYKSLIVSCPPIVLQP